MTTFAAEPAQGLFRLFTASLSTPVGVKVLVGKAHIAPSKVSDGTTFFVASFAMRSRSFGCTRTHTSLPGNRPRPLEAPMHVRLAVVTRSHTPQCTRGALGTHLSVFTSK